MTKSSEKNGPSSSYLNKSLDKALSILDIFDSNNSKMSVTEIAEKYDTNPSSLYPILHTLERHGYLKRDGNKRYSLGLTFPKKGRLVLERLNLPTESRADLERLGEEAQKTVHLGYLSDNQVVYLDKVESKTGIRMYSSPGKTAPLHGTALGKAILAHLPKDKTENILESQTLTAKTDNTITSPDQLKQEFEEIKQQGYALDDEEFEEGIKCVAAPIHKHNGQVEAAVSLTGLAAQMGDEDIEDLAMLVVKHAKNISSKLGYGEEDN